MLALQRIPENYLRRMNCDRNPERKPTEMLRRGIRKQGRQQNYKKLEQVEQFQPVLKDQVSNAVRYGHFHEAPE